MVRDPALRCAGDGHCLAIVLFLDSHLQLRSSVPIGSVRTAESPLLGSVERSFCIPEVGLRQLDVDANRALTYIHHIAAAIAGDAITGACKHDEFMSPSATAEPRGQTQLPGG